MRAVMNDALVELRTRGCYPRDLKLPLIEPRHRAADGPGALASETNGEGLVTFYPTTLALSTP